MGLDERLAMLPTVPADQTEAARNVYRSQKRIQREAQAKAAEVAAIAEAERKSQVNGMAAGAPRGPVPKRSDQRRRRNVSSTPIDKAPSGQPADVDDQMWLEPSENWHPIATQWYVSLSTSGQSVFYEDSDIATAFYVAEGMSRSLSGARMSGQMFAAVMGAMTELLTTEGARRRARIELDRGEPEEAPPKLAIMDGYRKAVKPAEEAV